MIILEVLSANGVAPDPPIRALLKSGDTIGRGANTTLPLPDPERRVSRVHAQLAQRQNSVRIVARGATPLLVDGIAVEIGEEVNVVEGARIEIGGYLLLARVQQPSISR